MRCVVRVLFARSEHGLLRPLIRGVRVYLRLQAEPAVLCAPRCGLVHCALSVLYQFVLNWRVRHACMSKQKALCNAPHCSRNCH